MALVSFGVLFGSAITVANLVNWEKSPLIVHGSRDVSQVTTNDKLRIVFGSLIKGTIYGVFYPVGLVVLVNDLFAEDGDDDVDRHFIIFSKYPQRHQGSNRII